MRRVQLVIVLPAVLVLAACGAAATATPGVKMAPPWSAAERAEYVLEVGGKGVGSGVFTVIPNDKGYIIVSETSAPPVSNTTRVQVDKDLRPLGDTMVLTGTGSTDLTMLKIYDQDKGKLSIEAKTAQGSNAASVSYPANAWDNDQLLTSLRALPLTEGYTFTVPIFAGSTAPISVNVKVVGTEQVEVPAGNLKAYKVELDFGQGKNHAWYAVDKPHHMVKYERPEGPQRLLLLKVGAP